ncbi:radical SAM protein [Candidatus Harpocratesius sp.]
MRKTATPLIEIGDQLHVPLFGLDFLGILDRGTNVLEVKPITICNLYCKYCFVSAGDYRRNFLAEPEYLLKWIKKAVEIKQDDAIEVHLAPYGEIFLYSGLEKLIKGLRNIPKIATISMQTNGLLLNSTLIQKLESWGLNRLNISLNSMDEQACANYCGVKSYNLSRLLQTFEDILSTNMDLLIAPVWFKGVNDQGIEDIISYAVKKRSEGYEWPKFRLGIQNYLVYKTGRKIHRAKMREFSYFYSVLHKMEQKTGLKLKLGPDDFDIHKTFPVMPSVRRNQKAKVKILMQGRWKNEYIAQLDENWAVKVLSKVPLQSQQHIQVKFIKSLLHGNLLTAIPSD